MQVSMGVWAVISAAIFALSEWADWRRRNRKDVDSVGFMPWRGISLAAVAAAIFCTALWLSTLMQ